ncbi:hypothetical protein D3C79_859930 [compost metagenome]
MPRVSSSMPSGMGAVSSQLSQTASSGRRMNSSRVSIHIEKAMKHRPSESRRVTRPAGRPRSSITSQPQRIRQVPPSPATSIQLISAQALSVPAAR